MRLKWNLAAFAAVVLVNISGAAQAFECPAHFAEAKAVLSKVEKKLAGTTGKISKTDMVLLQTHLRNAKMSIIEAKYHHTQHNGAYHHTRAIVRANESRGHALAADSLYRSLVKD